MKSALCNFDNLPYEAEEFSNLSDQDFSIRKRALVCKDCREQAWFRRAGRDGRKACFFSKHLDSCVGDRTVNSPQKIIASRSSSRKIIVVLNDIDCVQSLPLRVSCTGVVIADATSKDANALKNSSPSDPPHHFRAPTILEKLYEKSMGGCVITVADRFQGTPREFFVDLHKVTTEDVGKFRGYLDLVDNVQTTETALFVNTGLGFPSVRIDLKYVKQFERVLGIYKQWPSKTMLVIGELKQGNGKLFLKAESVSCFALSKD